MKYFIGVLLVLLSIGSVFAEEDGNSNSGESEFGDVQYFDFDLHVELDGGIVKLEWNEFLSGEGFQWYKLMYSTTIQEPVYPDQNASYVGGKRSQDSHKMALKDGENHYFRICAITLGDNYSKERFCSTVQSLSISYDEPEKEEVQETKEYIQRYKDIEYYDFDFQVNISDNGVASTRWNSYLADRGFTYYKLLYSTKYANPSYPEISAKYVGSNISDSSKDFNISAGEDHYFRICAITNEGYGVTGRYCSKTRKFTIEEDEQSKVSDLNEETKVSSLSDEMKKRIDEVLNNFIIGLKEKSYSEEKIVTTIDIVLERLDTFKDQEKYTAIIEYMEEILLDYRDAYDDPIEDLSEIFLDL